MQVANEIQSALKNIRYYSQTIKELSKKQFEADLEQGQILGMDGHSGKIRLESLGAIESACKWLDVYCDDIEMNTKNASDQDKLLYSKEK